jgi:aminopeptidase N
VHTLSLLERLTDKTKMLKAFKEEVALLAINDGSNKVRAAAWSVLAKAKVKGYETEMIAALADSSYAVAGAALDALGKINKDTAYLLAKEVIKNNPKASLESAAWSLIAGKGDKDDISFFERQADYVYGTRKLSFASTVNVYNTSTKDIESYERGLKIITDMAANESIKSYRYYLGSLVFASADHYRSQEKTTSDKNKAEENKRRLVIAEEYKQMVLSNEKDPGNLKSYKELDKSK